MPTSENYELVATNNKAEKSNSISNDTCKTLVEDVKTTQPNDKKLFWKKIFKLLFLILFILTLISIITIIYLLLEKSNKGLSSKDLLLKLNCERKKVIINFGEDFTLQGQRNATNCSLNKPHMNEWIVFKEKDLKLLSSLNESAKYSMMSPLLKMPPKVCGLKLSCEKPQRINILSADATFQKEFSIFPNRTTKIEDAFLLALDEIYIIVTDKRNSNPIIHLTYLPCIYFTPIDKLIKINRKLETNFLDIQQHQGDRCSFEYIKGSRLHCNWRKFSGKEDMDEFKLVDSTGQSNIIFSSGFRLKHGKEKYFLSLIGNSERRRNTSKAYIISPIFHFTDSKTTTISLYHIMCNGTTIKAYIVPKNIDILNFISNSKPAFEFTKEALFWNYTKIKVQIPANFSDFQVVLEGTVSNSEKCGDGFFNSLSSTIGVDDLYIHVDYQACSKVDVKTSILDVNFENNSYGLWIRKLWMIYSNKTHENHIKNLFTENHQHILGLDLFEHASASSHSFFRTPFLLANSNCTCQISFNYFENNYEPVLALIQTIGVKLAFTSRKTLWYESSSMDSWRTSTVEIKLVDDNQPFVLEFTSRYLHEETKSYTYIDNIRISNCDLFLYKKQQNKNE